MLVDWLKTWPLKNNKWGTFFEDIPTHDYSDTAINAGTLAWYILEKQTAWDADWKAQAASTLDWVDKTFSNREWEKYGVIPTNEQTAYQVPGNSHSSRHSSVALFYCEKTGDCARKPAAIARLHWQWSARRGRRAPLRRSPAPLPTRPARVFPMQPSR